MEYAYNTESDTPRYFRNILQTPLAVEESFRVFLNEWRDDESRHAGILRNLLDSSIFRGVVVPDPPERRSPTWVTRLTPYLYRITWVMPRYFCAIILAAATVNELSAFLGYARLARHVDDPALRSALGQIAGDERRHAERFAAFARKRLDGYPSVARFVKWCFRALWAPVGSKANEGAAFASVAAILFGVVGPTDRDDRLDELSTRLLGFEIEPSTIAAKRIARVIRR